MKKLLFLCLFATSALAQNEPHGPYARIAFLKSNEGQTVDFEAGYIRHLGWHKQAGDTFNWYAWTLWASADRQRWLVYATFGHTAESLGNPVSPAEDERDTLLNVIPHSQFTGSGIYEFLPALSRGNGMPSPTQRTEFTTVELKPGSEKAFETAIAADQSTLRAETLWYRMIAGGPIPCYVRLRPRANLAQILDDRQPLPARVDVERVTVEIMNFRPTMSYGVLP